MNEQPTTPSTPAAAPTPAATPAQPIFTPELNPAQAETMAGWIKADLAAGKLTPEQAAKSFDELGTPAENRTDTRTEAAKELDAAGLAPADKPEDYVIHYGVEMTPEGKQFDTAARTWLHGAGFPKDTGNSLVTTIGRVAQQTAKMSQDQLVEYGQREMVKLQKTYGDSLGEKW